MAKQRMTQYNVLVKNEPGELHKVAQILAKSGITLSALSSPSVNNVGLIQFVSESGNVIRKSLEQAGYEVMENTCFSVDLPNRPEEFLRLTKALADEDVNIQNIYGTANHGETWKLCFSVDKPEKAHNALSRLGELAAAA